MNFDDYYCCFNISFVKHVNKIKRWAKVPLIQYKNLKISCNKNDWQSLVFKNAKIIIKIT